jgi:cell wall-associated NlpC family hydrolase
MSDVALSRPSHSLSSPIIGFVLMLWAIVPARAQGTEGADKAKPFTAMSASVHTFRDSLVAVARAQIGRKYVRGGTTPERGFDCSGLVRYVMASLAVHLPRTARQQATAGTAIARETRRLRPGDLLTFGKDAKGVSHIGIYVGDGRYVHASPTAGHVIESDLGRTSSPLVRAWRGVRRVVSASAADSLRLADGG